VEDTSRVETCSSLMLVMNCNLLCAFVGRPIGGGNVRSENSAKKIGIFLRYFKNSMILKLFQWTSTQVKNIQFFFYLWRVWTEICHYLLVLT